MVFWDDLGFATNYSVDAEPEYPGNGEWGFPEHRVLSPASDILGAPQALVRPGGNTGPWLLVTEFATLGALYATPDPDVICVFDQLRRLVFVNVQSPSQQTMAEGIAPVRMAASVDQGLLLVCEWAGITAFGSDGVRWRAPDLVADLHITRADGDRIYYRGAGESRGWLDARTGEVLPR
jgi:hypothetical protein